MKQTNFLQRCVGIALIAGSVLFGTGFLIRSVQTAHAAPPAPAEFIAEGTDKIGKYQMGIGNDDKGNIRVLVWDTETGKAELFSEKIVGNEWTIAPSIYKIPMHTLDK